MKFSGPFLRTRAYLDMYLADHGAVRAAYNNLYALPGGLYRSSQPSPAQLARYQRDLGIRSVINLRGPNDYGSYFLEVSACQALGLELHNTRLYSRTPPSVEEIHAIKTLFESVSYPALMHCKSGADRAGMGAALYRILICKDPIEVAMRELHWKYGHFKRAKTGILDYFFATFAAWQKANPKGDFMTWVDTVYNEETLKKDFHEGKVAAWVVDKVLHRE